MSDPWRREVIKSRRYLVWPVPEMAIVGARFRNGRNRTGLSQREIAFRAGVSQSAISRLERGVSTGTSAERLIRIAAAIGPHFPFGFCPHNHRCPYPFDPRNTHFLDLD